MKKYRAFWINHRNDNDCDLDDALRQGHRVTHFGVTPAGILVITDGTVPVQPALANDQRHRAAPSDASIFPGPDRGSGARFSSAMRRCLSR